MIRLLTFLIFAFTLNSYAQDLSELSKSIANKKTEKSNIDEVVKSPLQVEETKKPILQEEKENAVLNYSNISNVLKKDGLAGHKEKKEKEIKEIKKIQNKMKLAKYNYPDRSDFWSFMSEYWLVKKAQTLQWDITRPAYGIKDAFKNLLEELGYFKKKFKILIVNSPDITHMGLPSDKDEFIMLLSLPFMRTLDLTKVDISLLMLENFFRIEQMHFAKNIKGDLKFLGGNFADSKMNKKYVTDLLEDYDKVIYKSGFSFQQQYQTTKMMDRVLKSNPALWSAYIKLLNKIDRLIKVNLLYKNYNNIYPSPELQIKWLTPKKKVI